MSDLRDEIIKEKLPNVESSVSQWDLASKTEVIEETFSNIETNLKKLGWPEEEIDAIHSAFSEAMMNAIGHGNLGLKSPPPDSDMSFAQIVTREENTNPTAKTVRVEVEISKDQVVLKIMDQGDGFNTSNLSDPTDSRNLLRPNGRGIFFMRSFFDDVTFNEKGNKVTLVKKRKPDQAR